jgi:hypothetical protein
MNESVAIQDAAHGVISAGHGMQEQVSISGHYTAQCHDADGNLLWSEEFDNLVTTVGKNDLLDKYLAGSAYTPTLFVGLKGTGTAVVGDTQASHAGWAELGAANAPAYSGTRKTPTFGAAAAGSKATTAVGSFTFTSSGTVAGIFLNNGGTSAIDNTTGILYSAGDFGVAQPVISTNVLTVTYTASA